jgi:hypothetical protein
MSKAKGNVNSKNYTQKTAEEKTAFDRINPQVDTSRAALQKSIIDSLNNAAIDKTGETQGITNADAMQKISSLGTYEASKSVDNAAQIASLASRAWLAGSDQGQRDKAQKEMNALKAQMGFTQIEDQAATTRAGNAASEDITKTTSDAAVDRAKMGALYSTASAAIAATSGPSSTTNADNSITTDQRFMTVKLPGLSRTIAAPPAGGGNNAGLSQLAKSSLAEGIKKGFAQGATPFAIDSVYEGSTSGKALG